MSITKVREYFKQYDMEQRIKELTETTATVEEAAQALGCEPDRIAKTLSFSLGEQVILILFSGNTRVDNAKYRQQFQKKAKMLTKEEVEQKVGHQVGGVCPFAINPNIDVYLDVSLKKYHTVFPACGSSNSAIELSIEELEKYSLFKEWIDVGK